MKFKFLILVLLSLCVTLNAQIISENGIATDSATGLVWQDEPYTQVEKTAYDKNTNNGKVGNWEYSTNKTIRRADYDYKEYQN